MLLFRNLAVVLLSSLLVCYPALTVAESDTALPAMVDRLEEDVESLRALHEKIDEVSVHDKEGLSYRVDDRVFSMMRSLNFILGRLADLEAEDHQTQNLSARLQHNFSSLGQSVFIRLEQLRLNIEQYTTEAEALSGSARVATDAYIASLEALRFRYYEMATKTLNAHNQVLGTSGGPFSDRLREALFVHAETLVGRIEFSRAALAQVKSQQSQSGANADVAATAQALDYRLSKDSQRMRDTIMLLDQLQVDSSDYKGALLLQGGSVSFSFLDASVLRGLLLSSWDALRSSAANRLPDLMFNAAIFLGILLIFRSLAKITRRVVGAACERSKVTMTELLKRLLVSGSGTLVMFMGLLMALSQVGISLGPMLAGLGVAGFIVGFALQDSLSNFAAGAMILLYRPYDVDDFVEVAGASGLVKEMSLVSTTILTFDNQTLVVPNSKIWGDVIKNVTAQKVRRVDLEFGISYSDDVEHTEKVLAEIIAEHDLVLAQPETLIKLHTLGDSSVNFIVRPWTLTENYWRVYWDILREVKLRFDREGISIPFPQRDVHLYEERR